MFGLLSCFVCFTFRDRLLDNIIQAMDEWMCPTDVTVDFSSSCVPRSLSRGHIEFRSIDTVTVEQAGSAHFCILLTYEYYLKQD